MSAMPVSIRRIVVVRIEIIAVIRIFLPSIPHTSLQISMIKSDTGVDERHKHILACVTQLPHLISIDFQYVSGNLATVATLSRDRNILIFRQCKFLNLIHFQHIIALRINYAKRLLRFTDKSVEEISVLCGFNDQSYFSKQFKKAENVTCLAFRRRWRD